MGHLAVNGPVLILLFGPAIIISMFFPNETAWSLAAFLCGFVLAWLYWSISLPKWRLWAYERVVDIPKLKRAAVDTGLMWREGHFFERCEIKSAAHAAREKDLESRT